MWAAWNLLSILCHGLRSSRSMARHAWSVHLGLLVLQDCIPWGLLHVVLSLLKSYCSIQYRQLRIIPVKCKGAFRLMRPRCGWNQWTHEIAGETLQSPGNSCGRWLRPHLDRVAAVETYPKCMITLDRPGVSLGRVHRNFLPTNLWWINSKITICFKQIQCRCYPLHWKWWTL